MTKISNESIYFLHVANSYYIKIKQEAKRKHRFKPYQRRRITLATISVISAIVTLIVM